MALEKNPLRWPMMAATIAAPYFLLFPQLGVEHIHWLWVGLVMFSLAFRMWVEEPLDKAGPQVSAAVFGAVYCSMIAYLVPLRQIAAPSVWGDLNWGKSGWVILVCVLSWWGDTGAYFFGRYLGKHKLAPRISPSKTWEGFFGGLAASVGAGFFTKLIILPSLPPADCVFIGLIAGILGPIGDLAESMLKRSFHVKDSSHLLPGHGGMLDRIDGLVFNGIVVYAYYFLVIAGRAG
jgi:phosphatidate cytidylyltransferase